MKINSWLAQPHRGALLQRTIAWDGRANPLGVEVVYGYLGSCEDRSSSEWV